MPRPTNNPTPLITYSEVIYDIPPGTRDVGIAQYMTGVGWKTTMLAAPIGRYLRVPVHGDGEAGSLLMVFELGL